MKYTMTEISHFSHPDHKLMLENSELLFKCEGCKEEVGIGFRYRCPECDFDLHVYRAVPAPNIDHPFYTKCSFQFLSSPPGDGLHTSAADMKYTEAEISHFSHPDH
ncbi:hypothetical protein SAY86_023217 [Trapa natans]|uniref:DC1 domain-containing protein n=1 Tax=Trapa natans TaxID=22666 RepID=A0AAN7R7N4_TRANT|nr:hypothetical protein SAY86_023217 [Trapa natans]